MVVKHVVFPQDPRWASTRWQYLLSNGKGLDMVAQAEEASTRDEILKYAIEVIEEKGGGSPSRTGRLS